MAARGREYYTSCSEREREGERRRETTHALFCHFHQIVTISVQDGRDISPRRSQRFVIEPQYIFEVATSAASGAFGAHTLSGRGCLA